MREQLERKMTGLIFGLKNGKKEVSEVLPTLNRMKRDFPLIAEDFEKKYITALAARK